MLALLAKTAIVEKMASPSAKTAIVELSNRLHKCWSQDLNWDLYTDDLKNVS